jgi:hypothetical protein
MRPPVWKKGRRKKEEGRRKRWRICPDLIGLLRSNL